MDKQSDVELSNVTLTDSVISQLRKDIILRVHKPDAKLLIRDLCDRYGTGASPIREALNRMVSVGLVESAPRRGFRVASLSKDDLLDLTRLRKLIESEALRLSMQRGDEVWEGQLVSAFHALSKIEEHDEFELETWEHWNWKFHSAAISACGSVRLLHFAEYLYNQHRRYRAISFEIKGKIRNIHEEHKQILDSVLQRDFESANKFCIRHIENTAKSIIDQAFFAE